MDAKRSRLLSMTYNEIRSLCRERGLKATGTKVKLVETLSETMIVETEEEQMDVEEQKENLNGTFTMEEDEISVIPKDQLKKVAETEKHVDITLDESIIAGNFMTPDNSPIVRKKEEKQQKEISQGQVQNVTTRSTRNASKAGPSRIPKPGFGASAGKGRFDSAHSKVFSNMASIDDHQKKLEAKHADYVKGASETINRLATPKSQREKARKFPPPTSPTKESFKFGATKPEQIEKVQLPYNKEKADSSRVTRSRQQREPQADVKKITMAKNRTRTIKATIPDCSERIEQLATPKSAGPVTISKERKSYTPKTTPYKYIDTTKMSNAELRAYDARQKRLDARSKRLNFH